MRASTTSAMLPHTSPSKSWLTATEVKLAPPAGAKRESAAEVKIKSPETTRMHSTRRNGVSIVAFFMKEALQQCDDHAYDSGDGAYYPVAHGDLVGRPPLCFEVVVQRRHFEELAFEYFFAQHLGDVGEYGHDQQNGDDGQHRDAVAVAQ